MKYIVYIKQVNVDKIKVEAEHEMDAILKAKGQWKRDNPPLVESVTLEGGN